MIGVLVSGNGSNLQALIDDGLPISAVAANRKDAFALIRARQAGIPTATFSLDCHESREERDLVMATWLEEHGVELVVLAGYMQLVDPAFLARFPRRVINVHPTLLPAFPGIGSVEQAVAYGVKVFGITVHFVDEGVDTGPIIAQRAVDLPHVTDPDDVRRALHPIEHDVLTEVVRLIGRGAVGFDRDNPRRVVVRR
jgi:phosphoribosylglycinamide formyltransferase 1